MVVDIDSLKRFLESKGIKIEDIIPINENMGFAIGSKIPSLPKDIEDKLSDLAREYAGRLINEGKITEDNFDRMYEYAKQRDPRLARREKLGTEILKVFPRVYQDRERVDLMDCFDTICLAFLAFLKSQSKTGTGTDTNVLTVQRMNFISKKISYYMGEELAKLGLCEYLGDKENKPDFLDHGIKKKEDLE